MNLLLTDTYVPIIYASLGRGHRLHTPLYRRDSSGHGFGHLEVGLGGTSGTSSLWISSMTVHKNT